MSALMASSMKDTQGQQQAFAGYTNKYPNMLQTMPESDPEKRFHALAATGDRQMGLDLLDKLDRHFEDQQPKMVVNAV